jgi:hypothetical protein
LSEVNSWSTTAASNNTASPDGFPEAMAPSGVNDSAREVMAALARYRSDTDGVNASTGSANAYVLAASRVMTAYAQGDRYCFEANFANTGAATLNVDSLGAKDIKRLDGSALLAGDIQSGAFVDVIYDGTNFLLLNRFVQAASETLSGIVELATDAEALAGTDTDRAVTSAGLASDQTKANTGHVVLPGGILLNWARLSFSASVGPVTETWAKAFSGTPYVAMNGRDLDVNAHVDLSTFNVTTIGATLSTAGTGTVYVLAIGPA